VGCKRSPFIHTASFDRPVHHQCYLYTTYHGYCLGRLSTAIIVRRRRIFNPFHSGPRLPLVVKQPTSPMYGIGDSFLPLCGSNHPAGVAPCVILPLLPSHIEALYRSYKSTVLPHFPPTPLMRIASLGIVEDGLLGSAPEASLTPSCRSPLDPGSQPDAARGPYSEEFVSFAVSGPPRSIPSGKSTHRPDPHLECRTKFEVSTLNKFVHTRTIEFPLASGVVWFQESAPVTEDREMCLFSSFPKSE